MNGQDLINFALNILQNNSNYSNIDMSQSGVFFNLTVLPFSVLVKALIDLNTSNMNALGLSTMTSAQIDNWATWFFENRQTQNLMTVAITIYLTNTTDPTEPLVVSTSDQFTTGQNQSFAPIQDYIFAYNLLPMDPTNTYRIATIIASSSQNYSQIGANTIKSSSLLHPLLAFVTNLQSSSSPISAQSDADFITSIQQSISQRNNTTSDALSTNLSKAFPQITDSLSIGYGDPEMQRDIAVAGEAWSGHFGGMTDIYVRTPLTPVSIVVPATRNSTNNGYTFLLRKYQGYDWNVVDTSAPDYPALTPWIPIPSVNPLPSMPVMLIDWETSSITNTTFALGSNGLVNYLIEVMPDSTEKSYGKNYRYSPYESLRITIFTNSAANPTENITFNYSTLSNIEDIQTFINSSANRVLTSNNLIKSFIPIEIKDLNITYDSRYSVDETTWATTLANIINGWSLGEPIRFTTLLNGFPAPTRIDEIWYDTTANPNLPYTTDSLGNITGAVTPAASYPCYAAMQLDNIDGSYQYYLSTRQIYPLVKNGLSSTYRTCRYFIDPSNIHFNQGSW